jgi:hypothetical protein
MASETAFLEREYNARASIRDHPPDLCALG